VIGAVFCFQRRVGEVTGEAAGVSATSDEDNGDDLLQD
jgi:hypothetical protein